ncbi:MAG: hypothetical protein JWN34_4294 [Bryobacterales bacterium]|jgi:uncharacterized protein (TIGR03435 family)|nr:hypothetical protein [Bryobacterales bacterium]
MKQFVGFLSGPLEAPVADETSLTGKYDLQFDFARYVEFTSTHQSEQPGAAWVLNAALKGELGLQITPRKTNFDIIVVDHVDEPTPN